jgi:hypothetical protein
LLPKASDPAVTLFVDLNPKVLVACKGKDWFPDQSNLLATTSIDSARRLAREFAPQRIVINFRLGSSDATKLAGILRAEAGTRDAQIFGYVGGDFPADSRAQLLGEGVFNTLSDGVAPEELFLEEVLGGVLSEREKPHVDS